MREAVRKMVPLQIASTAEDIAEVVMFLAGPASRNMTGEIKDGNGKRQIVIDERADEAQRIALETIISGEASSP